MLRPLTRWAPMLGAFFAIACHEPVAAPARQVEITVTSDGGRPLAGVPVSAGALPARVTDASGQLRVALRVADGRVSVRAICPHGHRPAEPRIAELRHGALGVPIRLRFVCRPNLRDVAVVVLAPDAAGHAVQADGLSLGAIAEDGTFHALVQRAPGSQLRLFVEPLALPLVNNALSLVLADRDELVVLTPTRAPSPVTAVRRLRKRMQKRAPRSDHYVPYAVRRERS